MGFPMSFKALVHTLALHPLIYRAAVFGGHFIKGGRNTAIQEPHKTLLKKMPGHAAVQALAILFREVDPNSVKTVRGDNHTHLELLDFCFR